MVAVLALTNWMIYARVARGIVLSVGRRPYVEAAEMIGAPQARVIFRHILPNLASPLLTLAILEFANVVLAEAALSFLGLGVQPPATSWGLDIATGKDYLFIAWWLVTFPGLCISITVLSINLVASWLRVTSDPQEREKRFARARRPPAARGAAGRRPPGGRMNAALDKPLLEIERLEVEFDTRRGVVRGLRGVDLSIGRGETLGIVGESGSGKSVTAQAVMGLVDAPGRIAGGDIRWKGRSLLTAPGARYGPRDARPRDGAGLPGRDDLARPAVHLSARRSARCCAGISA